MNVSGVGGYNSYQTASAMGMSRPPGPPPGDEEMETKISEFLTSLDSDESGSLSQEESGVSATSFDAMDTNGDGEVSAEELMAYLQANRPPPPPPSSSGSEETEETTETVSGTSFDPMDTNEDGEVSAEEFMAYIQANRPPPPPPSSSGTEGTEETAGTQSVAAGTNSQTGTTNMYLQQAIEAYSSAGNELLTSLFDYLQEGSQYARIDVSV
jgi:hypothetical protein